MPTFVMLSYGPTAQPGAFAVAHGLGRKPHGVILQPQTPGKPWFGAQEKILTENSDFLITESGISLVTETASFDDININLIAPDAGITGKVIVW
jgi:hypothetical protein